jgi:hypothetical protein
MHYNFNTSDSKGNTNTGSSARLVSYLEKETKGSWFNHEKDNIEAEEVKTEIDAFGKGQLKAHEWKFIEIEVNPSHKEQQIIIEKATGKKDVNQWEELNPTEKKRTIEEFQNYIKSVQDEQAKNYNRENIKTGNDLKYYAKIETQRKINGYDEEYKKGQSKQGEFKKGLQLHAHIVQSRKASDKKTKLSPESKHLKQSEKSIIKQGFNRNIFANRIEKSFDEMYKNERQVKETYEWHKANKYMRLERKIQLENQYNNQNNKEMKTIQETHQDLAQRHEIETYKDYVNAMEQENIKVKELKNEKNEVTDLQLKTEQEEVKFSDLELKNEEIKSRWLKEQGERRAEILEEQRRLEEIRKEEQIQKEQEEQGRTRKGLGL